MLLLMVQSFRNKYTQQMSVTCLNCRGDGKTMVELTCEHQLCLQCANKIKIPEGMPPLDAKFRICCPTCRKNTFTLDIQNIVSKDNDKLLFVNMESSELSQEELEQPTPEHSSRFNETKLRKMSYSERYAERRTPEGERSGRQTDSRGPSRSRGESLQVQCTTHKELLMFYCEQEGQVMCMQCMYRHMKEQKNHSVCAINDAMGSITRQNAEFKSQARKRVEEIDRNISVCRGNKGRIEQAYQVHQQLIAQEFKELEALIRRKEEENRQYLERVFKRKEEEIEAQVSQLNYIRNCLKEHHQFSTDTQQAQLYFFNSFCNLRTALSKYSLNYKQIKKEQFFCFDKHASIDDISALLQKFYRPRADGRESKAPISTRRDQSNAPSRASQKNNSSKYKTPLFEEARKKLDKINRAAQQMQTHRPKKKKDHEDYLNDFFIEGVDKRDMAQSSHEKGLVSAAGGYRKSSVSEYADKKVIHKTLTPTPTRTPGGSKTKKR